MSVHSLQQLISPIRWLLLVLLICIQTTSLQAQEVLVKLQQQYNQSAGKPAERLLLAGKYITALFFNQQEEKAAEILKENISLALQQNDTKYVANLYAIDAMNKRIMEQIVESTSSIQKAKEYANQSKDLEIKGYIQYCEGWLQVRNNKEGEAVRHFLKAITLYDQAAVSATLTARKSSAYKELSTVYANWKEYHLQEKYSLLALNLAIAQNDPLALFDAYMLVGYMYEQQYIEDLSKPALRDKAERYYLKAVDTYHKHKSEIPFPSNLSFVANNLAALYMSYYPDDYLEKAMSYAELAKKQGLATQQTSHVASAYGIMAEIALKKNQPEKAKSHLMEALTEISKSAVPDQNIILSIYESLAEISEKEHNLPEAIHYQKRYMETFKSVFNHEQLALGKRLEAQFDKEIQQQQLITMQLRADKNEQQLSLLHSKSLQQRQEYENLKLHEENQRKELALSQLESVKRAQELKLSRLETLRRSQDILNYQTEISYKEKLNKYYIALLIVFVLAVVLLLYAYKQRSNHLRQKEELYKFTLDQQRQDAKISTLTAMLDGQENERGRIARDLHDGLGGLLSSTKMRLSLLSNQADNHMQTELKSSLQQLDSAVEELRRIAHNLMPDLLNRYGLKKALESYAIRMSNDRMKVNVQFLYYQGNLSKEKQLIVYRIIQELVNNAIKHASPTNLLIQFVEEEQEYILTVEDDGTGFDINKVKRTDSAGLFNIQSRVDFLKGSFNVASAPNEGSSIEIIFPNS